jgi:predicted DNA-binding transcriptional regulator YafY
VQQAGFPIYDHERHGKKYWRLEGTPLRGLERAGFTFAEASALYFSRSLLEGLAGTPFRDDLSQAFTKITAALSPATRRFLDQLPSVVAVKAGPRGVRSEREKTRFVARLLEASVQHRRVRMDYHSASKNRRKEYLIEPHQVVFGQGALYLVANVPEYAQVRTFAIHRVRSVSPTEETFTPVDNISHEVFPHSLGVFQGSPSRVKVAFVPEFARYIRERVWHASQEFEELEDGALVLTMNVSDDWALRTWVLGFGANVRVIEPWTLAEYVLAQYKGAIQHYEPSMFESSRVVSDASVPRLFSLRPDATRARDRGASRRPRRGSSRDPRTT